MAAFEIIALDPATPQLRAPGSADTYLAPRAFDIEPGTLTSAIPVLDMGVTWNSGATTFTGMRFNVTNTASNAASLLADFQVGGSSVFQISRAGQLRAESVASISGALSLVTNGVSRALVSGGSFAIFENAGNSILTFGNSFDTVLARDAANTLAQRNGTNAQTFRIYNTFTDASNYERGFMRWSSNVLQIGTEAAGTGVARDTHLSGASAQVTATNQFYISTTGAVRWGFNLSGSGNEFAPNANNSFDIGIASNRVRNIFFGTFVEGSETTDPAAPATDRGRLYYRDNGSGKTQLCVRFATGAVQVLATEP
jgi:hypothetical protein